MNNCRATVVPGTMSTISDSSPKKGVGSTVVPGTMSTFSDSSPKKGVLPPIRYNAMDVTQA